MLILLIFVLPLQQTFVTSNVKTITNILDLANINLLNCFKHLHKILNLYILCFCNDPIYFLIPIGTT